MLTQYRSMYLTSYMLKIEVGCFSMDVDEDNVCHAFNTVPPVFVDDALSESELI